MAWPLVNATKELAQWSSPACSLLWQNGLDKATHLLKLVSTHFLLAVLDVQPGLVCLGADPEINAQVLVTFNQCLSILILTKVLMKELGIKFNPTSCNFGFHLVRIHGFYEPGREVLQMASSSIEGTFKQTSE